MKVFVHPRFKTYSIQINDNAEHATLIGWLQMAIVRMEQSGVGNTVGHAELVQKVQELRDTQK